MILKVIGSSSKGNAYALIVDDGILLLECGMPLREVKLAIDYQISKVVGCLLTHKHKDHAGYLKEYLAAGIPIYTNDETQEDIDIITGEYLYGMMAKSKFSIGNFGITPFYVPHNDTPCFAYIIEHEEMGKLLFATDYEYLPYTFRNWRINHFLVECNYDMETVDSNIPNYEHKLMGHASIQVAREMIRLNKTPNLRNVILCHLGRNSGAGEYFTSEIQTVAGGNVQVMVAEPGLTVELMKEPF